MLFFGKNFNILQFEIKIIKFNLVKKTYKFLAFINLYYYEFHYLIKIKTQVSFAIFFSFIKFIFKMEEAMKMFTNYGLLKII